MNNNTSHSNGVLTTNVKHIQTVTLSLNIQHDHPGYFMGNIKCTVSPPVEGQEILINNTYIGGTVRTNKNGQATSRDGRLNKNSTVTVTVQPLDKDDHSYLGCTGTIQVTY